ncbi:MAG: helix-turn-helix domain-containing protein [Candidatus Solibacter sp.]
MTVSCHPGLPVNVSLLIRQRLADLGLDQKDLAAAAQVTESYISQLLARKKAPPSPKRTDIYEKIGKVLKLPRAELAKLADLERNEELRKRVSEIPRPLFEECREMIVRKCDLARRKEVQRIFEKEPFGELERLVTQKLLDFAQGIAREELKREEWLRLMAQHSDRSYAQVRVSILEFLDVDVFSISVENCISFLDPIIDAWDIDLKSFGMSFVPNRRFTAAGAKRFEFAEQKPSEPGAIEPGLELFLKDASLSRGVTEEEVVFLKALKLTGKRPSPIYYYRELQNLRDPFHFPSAVQPGESE